VVKRDFRTVGPLNDKSRRVASQMTAVLYPLFALTAVGFAATLMVHLASLFGNTYLFERTIAVLGPGVFVVFLPTIFVMNRLTRDSKQKDLWRAALRGCPRWMYRTVWGIFLYGWAGFFVLPLLYGGGMDLAANKARVGSGASGVFLVLYLIPLAIMYSATHVERFEETRRCLNGHRMSPLAKFCEECGARVATSAPEFRR
jgi:hypothetical protein